MLSPAAGRRAPRWLGGLVAAMLAAYAVMSFTASLSKGVAFDEGLQLAVGYNLWLNHDFRMEGANGDLVKRWATLPYLVSRPKFAPPTDVLWRESRGYELGQRFLFELGNRPEALLREARAMVVLLGVATGLLVFRRARELFGAGGGLIALALFVLSPAMLAFGGIVSTDMSITLTLFAATWCIWGLLHEVSAWRLLASLGWTGLLVLAKPSALAIFPIAAGLVVVKLLGGRPLVLRWRGRLARVASRRRQAGLIAGLVVLHLASGWAAIWAHYDFRYAASPAPGDPTLMFFQPYSRDDVPRPLVRTLRWIEQTHFLPEGFRRGIDSLLQCDDGLGSFMHGEWSLNGRLAFFPYVIWVKTPPALFVLLALGAACAGLAWRGARRAPPAPDAAPSLWYALTPCFMLIGCYLALALTEDINIGHRHVLPIYPALYVLAGAAALGWSRGLWPRVVLGGACVMLAYEAIALHPDYLAYFGPQAGGPSQGYKRLVDSSLDWGMDLPGLRRWIDRRNPGEKVQMFLAYFGSDRPSNYGIQARRLPGFLERRKFAPFALAPGYYAISASLLEGVYTAAFGPWNQNYEVLYRAAIQDVTRMESTAPDSPERAALLKEKPLPVWMNIYDLFDDLRFARLCAWLRHYQVPPEQVGHSILIWHLDHRALEAALMGPPAEMAPGQGTIREFRHIGP